MKSISIIIVILTILSCNKRQDRIQIIEDENLNQKQIDSIIDEYNFEYSRVVFIDSLEKVILPISTQNTRGGSRYSKKSYHADSYPNYWNLMFYDIKGGKTKLLTQKKTRISDFTTNFKNVGPILKKSVLYKAGDTDYNKDKKLTYVDPEQLFISDIDGNKFSRLSPINENLMEYEIVPNTDKIIFRTLRDSNGDKEFDEKDEKIWYLIDLSTESKAIEILNQKKRKEIENLYFKQWLVKNNKV
ncbi:MULTISPECIES: hypothetical protein [Aquimarina]|uniref:hypothetical protein n=1 Tax=Aquimarina TaxID=290174 RepID=UPI000942D848|nr:MULTISPECIES: hypothetical protein [Aquimarina]